MEALKRRDEQSVSKLLSVLLLCFTAILLLLFLCFDQYSCPAEVLGIVADSVIVSVGCISLIFGIYLYKSGRLTIRMILAIIFTLGFVLRLAYVIEYGYNELQHDVESLNSCGHLSYIFRISEGKGLPDSNDWQFSHPPLHHLVAAGVVWLSKLFGYSNEAAFENVQLLTLIYSTLIMFISVELFKELGLKGRAFLISFALVAFHPTFFIFAGSINNDCLTALLSLAAILFLVKWCKKKSLINAALIGLFVGLGMMTKFSASIVAVVVAITVIISFILDQNKDYRAYILGTVIFLIIMIPLGLWYQIRNMIIFDQPLGYVSPISTSNPLYIGDISIIKRIILPFSLKPVGVFVDVWEEYNLWTYVLRNSLFNEYGFGNVVIALFAVIFNFALIVISFVSLILSARRKYRIFGTPTFILGLFWLVQLLFFVYFNIRYPFGCTMDFRYIPLTVVCGAAFIGLFLQKQVANDGKLKILSNVTEVVALLFCVFCTLAFL